jgi:hypothetical protein
VRDGYLKGKWKDAGLWPEGASSGDELRRLFGRFYSAQYAEIAASSAGDA